MLNNLRFRILINSICAGGLFGFWMRDLQAGLFMLVLLGFIASIVDYFKAK